MAKSLRSKRKRKLRAEKRIVNAKKELVKLKSIVSNFNKSSAGAAGIDIVNFKGDKKAKMVSGDSKLSEEFMEVDQDGPKQTEAVGGKVKMVENKNSKGKQNLSLKNEHGNYPVWMNMKKIKSIKQKIKRHNKNKIGKAGHSITSRKSKKHIKR